MRYFLVAIILFLILATFLIGVGLGIGSLLHWIIRPIDIGTGTLIGMISTAISIHFCSRISSSAAHRSDDDDDEDEDEDEDEGEGASPTLYFINTGATRRRRKRKQ